VCEKNNLRFFRSSASGKQHISEKKREKLEQMENEMQSVIEKFGCMAG